MGPNVAVLVRTVFPVEVGGRLQVELPGRVRVGVHGGFMPGDYVDVINLVLVGFDVYNDVTAELIRSTISQSGIVGVDVGWRPLPRAGVVFDVGYMAAFLGGGLTSTEVVEAATGQSSSAFGDAEVDASSTLHLLTVDVGYEVPFGPADRKVQGLFRVDLGGAFTLHSNTRLSSDVVVGAGPLRTALDAGEVYLDDILQTYVQTPTITVSMGARFR